MSYCRFKNTSMDLGDCLDAIERGEIHDLVDYEYEGIQDILDYCEAILEYRQDLEEDRLSRNPRYYRNDVDTLDIFLQGLHNQDIQEPQIDLICFNYMNF